MTNQPIEGTVNTSSVTIDRRIVTPCENCKNGCTMFNQSPCKCNCHQPIEEKWKGSWDRAVEDLSGIYYKKNSEEWYKELEEHLNWLVTAQFMENPYKFEKESPLVKKKKEEIIAFIENLLEQERAERDNFWAKNEESRLKNYEALGYHKGKMAERKRMSEVLTVNLDMSQMLDGWDKYWIDAKNGRYIEGCAECGNSKRIKESIINK